MGIKIIEEFRGKYFFLSNFYVSNIPFEFNLSHWTSGEAAFQAMKCIDIADRERFTGLSPSEAKRLGRHIRLRPDWEEVKEDYMYGMLTAKFEHGMLRDKLVATEDALLAEGNNWGDTYWGYDLVKHKGRNRLGYLLMQLRLELQVDDWHNLNTGMPIYEYLKMSEEEYILYVKDFDAFLDKKYDWGNRYDATGN